MLNDLNDIEKYVYLKEEVVSIEEQITDACRVFVNRLGKKDCHYHYWKLNDRKTLIFIEYSFINDYDKHNINTVTTQVYCSFDEIQTIIDENKPKNKGYNG